MSSPTPEQLRTAAAHLARAATATSIDEASLARQAAWQALPDGVERRAIQGGTRDGQNYLAEAFAGWLQLVALWQEQEVRRVPTGHPDRNKKHEPCTACGRPRRDCGCEQDAVYELVRELLAGTSPAPAAGE